MFPQEVDSLVEDKVQIILKACHVTWQIAAHFQCDHANYAIFNQSRALTSAKAWRVPSYSAWWHELTLLFKVVPNKSSSLDSRKFGNDTIHANHMGMCRFQDKSDDDYEKFKGVLATFITGIKSEQQKTTKTSLEDDAIRRAG